MAGMVTIIHLSEAPNPWEGTQTLHQPRTVAPCTVVLFARIIGEGGRWGAGTIGVGMGIPRGGKGGLMKGEKRGTGKQCQQKSDDLDWSLTTTSKQLGFDLIEILLISVSSYVFCLKQNVLNVILTEIYET